MIFNMSTVLCKRYTFASFRQIENQPRDKDRLGKSRKRKINPQKRSYKHFSWNTINSKSLIVFQITYRIRKLCQITWEGTHSVIVVINFVKTIFKLLRGWSCISSWKINETFGEHIRKICRGFYGVFVFNNNIQICFNVFLTVVSLSDH